MIAPDTAPHMLPVFEIPAPKPQEIFFAASVSRPSSAENVENTADEQVKPLRKLARASSDFVILGSIVCRIFIIV